MQKCFDVTASRVDKVTQSQSLSVLAYDYYEPGKTTSLLNVIHQLQLLVFPFNFAQFIVKYVYAGCV